MERILLNILLQSTIRVAIERYEVHKHVKPILKKGWTYFQEAIKPEYIAEEFELIDLRTLPSKGDDRDLDIQQTDLDSLDFCS
jgi:hypothetical protein